MTTARIIAKSARFHWRIHFAVALGVAAATAVLTGALIIGDSVRGSLRHLVLDRLGKIDELLVVDRFFRKAMADELASQFASVSPQPRFAPAILFPSATVQSAATTDRRLAAGVLVVGSGGSFFEFEADDRRPKRPPGKGEIVVNQPLAAELNARVGDTLVVRLGKADQVPADSPLGRRSDRTTALAELKLIEIIPAEGLGRFGLSPSQTAPRNAYVSLADMQQALDVSGKVNAIFAGGLPAANSERADVRPPSDYLTPTLADYGLTLKHVKRTFGEGQNAETIFDYFSLSSDRLLLDPAIERIAMKAFASAGAEPVLTYLANDIRKVGAPDDAKGIPYSTITAIDPAPGGPIVDASGQPLPMLAEDEIVLTSWTAEDQQAKVGDRIRVTYFEPETTHGDEREATAEFRVKAIVPLTEPKAAYSRRGPAVFDERPTTANDPDLTPEVKGITDQASIADWDSPFPFDQDRIRPQDDDYWENHRTTPKAYVSLAAGQRLWGSRFGNVTSIRIPTADGMTAESLEDKLLTEIRQSGERLGFEFQPIKAQGLKAAAGTTPFDVLFLLLSMFIIAAALMLVWILFRLGIDQRVDEIGLLAALGWSRAKIRTLFLIEGGLIAAAGAAIGVTLGIGYAWLMIVALKTWWVGAIATPFLNLYVTPLSLIIGLVAGSVVSLATIWFGLGQLKRASLRGLLAGAIAPIRPHSTLRAPHSALRILPWLLFLAALGLAFYASRLGGEAQAGVFLAAGASLLILLLLFTNRHLRSAGTRSSLVGGAALARLAFRGACRNVGRSTATIALVASSAFLIVAVSAFRMSPTDQGVGGFDLLAESSQPIFEDLNQPDVRRDLLADQDQALTGSTVLSLRLKAGDDASCRNLYQPTQPRIFGVTPAMISHFDEPRLPARFTWSASAAQSDAERANPWRLLDRAATKGEPVPVVLDQNTARYSLRLYGGVGQTFDVTYSGGETITFRIVGLLANSVLQGNLLIGEPDFQRLFPQISGYRFFLIHTPPGKTDEVAAALEGRLSDEGFDVTDARARLADLLAVQNTYISTFQSLGALGLVLGTFGVAAVQLRNVFERRKELALMRATGFRRERLGQMVLLENLLLLFGGLGIGALAALVAVLPQMLFGTARPPLADLAGILAIVLLAGAATGFIAVRATLRAPLVAALRGE